MRYLLLGFSLGFLINLCLFSTTGSLEICPLFAADLNSTTEITLPSPLVKDESIQYPLRRDMRLDFVAASGRVISSVGLEGEMVAMSGNGKYYLSFLRTGKEVEFRGAGGERYWKIKSMEYPYISCEGRQVLLLNGDHSALRMVDFNGNVTGSISGRLCTSLSFSAEADNSAAGFMDGTYYVMDASGTRLMNGSVPAGKMVKGSAVSNNGMFACVHYGNTDGDALRIVDREKDRYSDRPAGGIHVARSSMHVGDDGTVMFLDTARLLCLGRKGKVIFTVDIPEKKPGHSSVVFRDPVYVAAYTDISGRSRALFVHRNGTLLYAREYPSETYLDARIMGEYIFLRGSGHLYAYRYRP